jgi:hypothetical protein
VVLVAELAAASALIAIGPAATRSPSAPPPVVSASAPLVVSDGRHVHGVRVDLVSLGGSRTDAVLERVSAAIGDAVGAVERFWGTDFQREIVVVATGSGEQFVEYAGLDPKRGWTDIAAVAVADDVDFIGRTASGQRIILAPDAAAMSDTALRIVLAHELFHLAARTGTALDAPRWLTEGVADFVARPPTAIPVGATAVLPSDAELDAGGADRAAVYDRAWWFARFVADSHGTGTLRRLYAAACGPGHADLAVAVRQVIGTDLADLQRRWVQWMAQEARR